MLNLKVASEVQVEVQPGLRTVTDTTARYRFGVLNPPNFTQKQLEEGCAEVDHGVEWDKTAAEKGRTGR
eukprot:1721156-Rhodomonas_salina.2